MKIGIIGKGHTKFGKDERDIGGLMLGACNQALNGSPLDDIDAIYISNFSSSFTGQCHLPSVLASKLHLDKEIVRVESACASGGVALKEAVVAIHSGLYDRVLVVGVEKMSDTPVDQATRIIASAAAKSEIQYGTTFPSLFALMARRHFHEYGTTEEHLARIAVKNHNNALFNPLAHLHKEISIKDVLNSRMIASPIKLLDCSTIADGAAALLLCKDEQAHKDSKEHVHLISFGHCVSPIELYQRERLTSMPAVRKAAQIAFQRSKLQPRDIDLAELHDCFTIAELIQMEDIGFCETGEGKKMIEEGMTEADGEIPINVSGGLKAKGHPIGATGVSQVVEIVNQLEGNAGKRQLKDANIGLCCNIGGSGGTAVVSIFSR